MSEDEWFISDDAMALLNHMQRCGDLDERKMRLLALSICRTLWEIMDEPCRAAVEVCERCIEGGADDAELDAVLRNLENPIIPAREDPNFHQKQSQYFTHSAIISSLSSKRRVEEGQFLLGRGSLVVKGRAVMVLHAYNATVIAKAEHVAATYGSEAPDERKTKHEIKRRLLPLYHDVLGNPFRPIVFAQDWATAEVTGLAANIYDGRAFHLMPELAGALDRAHCTVPEIIGHCRALVEHVRGCWVIDSILRKS
jgi:hypothetical protein